MLLVVRAVPRILGGRVVAPDVLHVHCLVVGRVDRAGFADWPVPERLAAVHPPAGQVVDAVPERPLLVDVALPPPVVRRGHPRSRSVRVGRRAVLRMLARVVVVRRRVRAPRRRVVLRRHHPAALRRGVLRVALPRPRRGHAALTPVVVVVHLAGATAHVLLLGVPAGTSRRGVAVGTPPLLRVLRGVAPAGTAVAGVAARSRRSHAAHHRRLGRGRRRSALELDVRRLLLLGHLPAGRRALVGGTPPLELVRLPERLLPRRDEVRRQHLRPGLGVEQERRQRPAGTEVVQLEVVEVPLGQVVDALDLLDGGHGPERLGARGGRTPVCARRGGP